MQAKLCRVQSSGAGVTPTPRQGVRLDKLALDTGAAGQEEAELAKMQQQALQDPQFQQLMQSPDFAAAMQDLEVPALPVLPALPAVRQAASWHTACNRALLALLALPALGQAASWLRAWPQAA